MICNSDPLYYIRTTHKLIQKINEIGKGYDQATNSQLTKIFSLTNNQMQIKTWFNHYIGKNQKDLLVEGVSM